MASPQPPRPGILPANSPIVSDAAYPHIPIEPTDPSAINNSTDMQEVPSVNGGPPQISEQRQDLSGALLQLAGTFIGNALEEGLGSGDGQGRIAKGVQAFAATGAGLLKERWYKENASNFNQMVFKPFEQAQQAAFQDYNQQMDTILNDPNIQPEERFAAARALQYKLSMTGKNLYLQVQIAAANPQFKTNPYVANTMATLLNHQEQVIGDLAKSHDVAMSDQKSVAEIEASRATAEGNRQQGNYYEAKARTEQETGVPAAKANIEQSNAAAAASRANAGSEMQKRIAEGDYSQVEKGPAGAERVLSAIKTDPKTIAAIDKNVTEPQRSEIEQGIIKDVEGFNQQLEQEFAKWASVDPKNRDISNPEKRPGLVEQFHNRPVKNLDKNSALRRYKEEPSLRRLFLAGLGRLGVDPAQALVPHSDSIAFLSDPKGTELRFKGIVDEQMREGAHERTASAVLDQAEAAAKASGRADLAEHIRTGPESQALGRYRTVATINQEIEKFTAALQEAQQHLAEAQSEPKVNPKIIKALNQTVQQLTQKIQASTQELQAAEQVEGKQNATGAQ